jgi:N-acetylglucosamine-6-phosphate deacetylase
MFAGVVHTWFMAITLAAKRLVTANTIIDEPLITLDGGTIVAISSRKANESTGLTHDFKDATLTAGLLDIHTHGAIGHDVMEGTTESLSKISRFLAHHGIAEYLATTVTASMDYTFRALDGMARHIEREPTEEEAVIRGIHLEGPFLSHAKRGMHPPQYIVPPSIDVLNKLWEAARGHIMLMTIAPENPGALELIARAAELGIRCSIGHSNANTAEALNGLKAGAVSATHTFNAMRSLDHRDPGILGVVLDRDEIYADLICDGVHVAPEMVRLWFKSKGPERAILITDSLEATGMPDGIYKLGETAVHVKDGSCTTEAGVLAGSVLTLDEAVRRMQQFTGADLPVAVRLASRNPARMLGLSEDLVPGAAANFNVYDAQGKRQHTILRGRLL